MATASTDSEIIEYDEYIDQQIDRTSFHLKTVDLVSGLIVLGLVVLTGLLVFVVIDHWVVGLSFGARFGCLLAVVLSSLFIIATRILPPLVRSINPEYAAQTVERSYPSLKNGLINFLFFRDRPDQVRDSVLEGMRAQAAMQLAGVPIDSAVDRTPIIKLGYALVAVAAIWVAYILLSPKNPLQTLARVATPWRDIQRPSQVDILDVMPGNVDVFQGQTVDVKAHIQGLKADSLPAIEFSTLDGQLLRQQIAMHEDGAAGHFAGLLTLGDTGIQQDLEYRIVAGDATSRTYEVHTTEAPHITVDRIEYDFPAYTRQPNEVVQGEGDIRAIEGTKITVHGKANQPMSRGHIEFLPALDDMNPNQEVASKQAALTVDGDHGKVRFTLRMDAKREQSVYRGYRLHFTNENDLDSVDPVEHSIEVVPDLRPIVQILTPDKRTIELPVNGVQKVEVRAVDPDYQLTKVQIGFALRKRPLVQKDLFTATRLSEAHTGQFVSTYDFVPSEHGLKEGDVVEYLAVAKDTRHSPLQNKLDPNRTTSAKQYIRIVAADPLADEPSKPDREEQPNRRLPEEDQLQDPKNGDQVPKDGDQRDQQRGDQNQEGGGDQQQQPGGEGNQQEQDEKQQGGQNGESGLQGKGQQGDKADQSDIDSGQSGSKQSDNSESQQGAGGNQPTDSKDRDGSPSQSDPSEGGESGDSNNSDGEASNISGETSGGDDNRGAREDEPLPSTGERDGEVVERIREHMNKNGELEDPESAPGDSEGLPNEPSTNEQSQAEEAGERNGDPSGEGRETQTRPEQADSQRGEKGEQGSESGELRDSQPHNGSQHDGTGSDEAKNGVPRDKSGAAGDQGDQGDQGERHTDAANSADKPGPSPSDGSGKSKLDSQPSKQNENGDPSNLEQQQGDSSGAEQSRSEKNASGESGQQSGQQSGQHPGEQGESGKESSQREQPGEGKGERKGEQGGGDQGEGKQGSKSAQQGDSESKKQGDKASDSSENPNSDGPKGTEGKSDQSNDGSKSNSTNKAGNPSGSASKQGNSTHGGEGTADSAIAGDDANVEYARKATDLVLEYLRDQEQNPDQELLEKLGWKPEDVQNFLRRWDQMKKEAEGEGTKQPTEGKRQLDDVLRGMGLKAPNNLRRSIDRNDLQRNNRDTGRRSKVPADLLDPFRAFQRALQQKK